MCGCNSKLCGDDSIEVGEKGSVEVSVACLFARDQSLIVWTETTKQTSFDKQRSAYAL